VRLPAGCRVVVVVVVDDGGGDGGGGDDGDDDDDGGGGGGGGDDDDDDDDDGGGGDDDDDGDGDGGGGDGVLLRAVQRMGDGKALQAGTSHNLGTNFARAFGTRFLNRAGESEWCGGRGVLSGGSSD
jgi:hypothetical protein